jgi:hypothetical protein
MAGKKGELSVGGWENSEVVTDRKKVDTSAADLPPGSLHFRELQIGLLYIADPDLPGRSTLTRAGGQICSPHYRPIEHHQKGTLSEFRDWLVIGSWTYLCGVS